MGKGVGVLLVGKLAEAIRSRSIETADSEPYWLNSNDYEECGDGVQLFPGRADNLSQYARERDLRPLGMVIFAENGDYFEFLNDDGFEPEDRAFVQRLFQVHAHFWFLVVPRLGEFPVKAS